MNPYPFQEIGARFLADRRAAALLDEMGLGKTVQALLAMDLVGAKTVLIIAPAIALDTWERQIATWLPGRRAQIVRSSRDAVNLHGGILLVSYTLVDRIKTVLRARRFDALVLDEAQDAQIDRRYCGPAPFTCAAPA